MRRTLRRSWWMVAAAIAALALALLYFRPSRGRPRTFWTAPWGPDGVSTVVAADGSTYGPLAFGAGSRDVVVADSFGHRLLFVPPAGGPAGSLDLGAGMPPVEELSVGGGDVVYFAGGVTVWRWRPGTVRPTRMADLSGAGPAAGLSLIEGLAALPADEGVAVDLLTLDRQRATRTVFVLEPGGRRRPIVRLTIDEAAAGEAAAPEAIVPAGGPALAAGPGGAVDLLGFTRTGQRAVFRFAASGRRRATLRLPPAGGRWGLIGTDRSGRVYLGVDLGSPSGRVVALSRRGRVVLSRALPLGGAVRLGAYVAVAPSGDLYVLDPTPGGLHLQRWRVRRRLARARRPYVAARRSTMMRMAGAATAVR